MRRRTMLLSTLLSVVAAGCERVPQRAAPTAAATSTPALDGFRDQARGMLTDSLQGLRTFDVFAAYRASTAADAGALAWDPPTGAAWDDATHVSRGLRGRADQLFVALTTAAIPTELWREQRDLADAAHELVDLGDALAAYRARVDVLPPGPAASALGLLDRAWAQWETAAQRFDLSRSEAIGCGSPARGIDGARS